MKLERAMLCVEMDCQEVYEASGCCRCPSCGTEIAIPLARILNAAPETEDSVGAGRGGHDQLLVFEIDARDVEIWEHDLLARQLLGSSSYVC